MHGGNKVIVKISNYICRMKYPFCGPLSSKFGLKKAHTVIFCVDANTK